ncbi:MAG: DotU family type IV/VI secretion system protein [Acidobacteriia bacterium]|nr:DotU family type IV/VI secretion system protein [Terriglobia bacterium]
MKSANAATARRGIALVPALNRVEVQLPGDPFLMARFEEFYREVALLKSQLAGHATASFPSAQEAQQRLLALLMRQESETERIGTLLGVEMYRQAQRVMAALADEIFATRKWPQGAEWPSLEAALFEVSGPAGLSPGGQCLKKLDQLLEQDDPVYRELAEVYFYVLAMREPGHGDTNGRMQALYRMIDASGNGAPADQRAFSRSYAHTLVENKISFLPSPRNSLLLLAAIVLSWLLLSSALWTALSAPIERQLDEIQRALP